MSLQKHQLNTEDKNAGNERQKAIRHIGKMVKVSLLLCCCFSVAQSCPTLCDPMDCSTPGFPVLHHLSELAQTHIH